ncbi:hypothetical protein FW774_13255 [Pedobacter sp. BS3]|uniref:RteC domain-containing protein n=1 Tax=Pedobacter sp. BS3 TaxID=2567937 RepID=UPI0011EDCBCE|nr:RteC domain-containing protein [Pedobacter sp. BS3]TZF83250.1 hypothetical protein FW774_13255 [Pedobacter sp. BS3]
MKKDDHEENNKKNNHILSEAPEFYDSVGLSINRMQLMFDEYKEIYPKALESFKKNIDGSETMFIQREIEVFKEILEFTEQEYTEEGIVRGSYLWDIKEYYRPWIKRIHYIFFKHNNTIVNSNLQKIEFLETRANELGIEIGTQTKSHKMTVSNIRLAITPSQFAELITALHEAQAFKTIDGKKLHREDLIKVFENTFNCKYPTFNQTLSQLKKRQKEKSPFLLELAKEFERYCNQ